MNISKFTLGVALFASAISVQAQDINQAKRAIDAEQYESAKSLLKSIIKEKPSNGEAFFTLGNVYLTQKVQDSAKLYFQNGLSVSDKGLLNNIGLGQMDLDANNSAAAQAKFALVTKEMRKKDFQEYIYIGRAYINAEKPDYKSAIDILNKAVAINSSDAQLQLTLGDAYYGNGKQNEAYVAYRNAFQADNTLLRAKMQLGVLLKGAKSYDEALKAYNEVIAINPNYGPVYRELAETYYKIARNKPSQAAANYKTAMGYYDKYMSLTDYSIHSRMRRADFMILVEDYVALEVEANKMIELDKVNPRIYRYLGYAAYKNGNVDLAIKSLENFINSPGNKAIALDYLYLGLTKIKKGTSADGSSIEAAALQAGLVDIKKAIEMEPLAVQDLSEVGKNMFSKKLYSEAAALFEFGANTKESTTFLDDNIYYGLAYYYANVYKAKDAKVDTVALEKSIVAFNKVLEASPSYLEAYLYLARTNRLLDKDDAMVKNYEDYVAKTMEAGAEEVAKDAVKAKIIESYNNIAASYANTDKAKAIEYFNKTLALDAANTYANESIKILK
ncbi:tetratricopeptide repeat protein [Flavobacterium galactosidilyticum]|uniref:tetratricopeptide repeat protein n=1 Tax=Flavobacterium galactosidilyticum TaxID=2893886 RepID=UPI001E5FF0DB|nr:tetratricopeptide repeat protein [Flavobacterium sp. F-340]UFH46794.1 tetratricopeptide repeat protein [Flavobacterium sp. F-340]